MLESPQSGGKAIHASKFENLLPSILSSIQSQILIKLVACTVSCSNSDSALFERSLSLAQAY